MARFLQLCLPFLYVKKELLLYRDKGVLMAAWASQGHGMRRRNGNPSNYVESAGNSMARSHQTSGEAYGAAAAAGSHRIAVGNDAYSVTPAPVLKGTLMPKHNTQAGDPTNPGSKQNRQNIEVLGASYRVTPKAMFVQLDPAAGPTMANARIIPSVAGRANPNFQGGEQGAYL
jgi:hypothetical protein